MIYGFDSLFFFKKTYLLYCYCESNTMRCLDVISSDREEASSSEGAGGRVRHISIL